MLWDTRRLLSTSNPETGLERHGRHEVKAGSVHQKELHHGGGGGNRRLDKMDKTRMASRHVRPKDSGCSGDTRLRCIRISSLLHQLSFNRSKCSEEESVAVAPWQRLTRSWCCTLTLHVIPIKWRLGWTSHTSDSALVISHALQQPHQASQVGDANPEPQRHFPLPSMDHLNFSRQDLEVALLPFVPSHSSVRPQLTWRLNHIWVKTKTRWKRW